MPVYNGAKYLDRSITSVLNQSYKHIELLLINDGSTDNSAAICKIYADSDNRVRYFVQDNHGQGYTRGRGIELANGEFVAFIDQDDYIPLDAYSNMLATIHHDNTDVCVGQWNYELPDGSHTFDLSIYPERFYGIKEGEEFASYLYTEFAPQNDGYSYVNGVVVSPWNKLYKKSLLAGFKANSYLGEDEDMNDYVLSQPNVRIAVIRETVYFWCMNLDSMSNRPFSTKTWNFIDVWNKRIKRYKSQFIKAQTAKLLCNSYIEYYYKSIAADIPVPAQAHNSFVKGWATLLKTGFLQPKFHIRMLLFNISPAIYKKLA